MTKKEGKYERLYSQLAPLLSKSPSLNAQISTINAVLFHKMPGFFWVGVYYVRDNELIVGPYQGPLACQILNYPNGVCWKAVIDNSTVIVDDVHAFPDHIACDSRSKSEIVIPIKNSNGTIKAVLDIDSNKPAQFDTDDKMGLEKIIGLLNTGYIDGL